MKKLALSALVLAACGSPEPLSFDGYTVTESRIVFSHEVGTTICPQDLDDIGVTNTGADLFVFTISVDDALATDVIDFGDADDTAPTSPGTVELELDPDASVSFIPWFNCSVTSSFSTTIHITPEDAGRAPASIPVTATIQ